MSVEGPFEFTPPFSFHFTDAAEDLCSIHDVVGPSDSCTSPVQPPETTEPLQPVCRLLLVYVFIFSKAGRPETVSYTDSKANPSQFSNSPSFTISSPCYSPCCPESFSNQTFSSSHGCPLGSSCHCIDIVGFLLTHFSFLYSCNKFSERVCFAVCVDLILMRSSNEFKPTNKCENPNS